MPLPPAENDILQLSWRGTAGSGTALQNGLHFRLMPTVTGTPDMGGMVNAIWSAIKGSLADCWSIKVSVGTLLYSLLNPDGTPKTDTVIAPTSLVTGTMTGDILPLRTAGSLKLRTGDPGPAKRGRLFMFPPNEDSNTADGFPSDDYKATLTTLGNNLVAPFAAGGDGWSVVLQLVILSKKNGYSNIVGVALPANGWVSRRKRSKLHE